MKPRIRLALLLAALSLSGCAGLGTLGDLAGGLPGTGLSGEIRRVDERRGEIRVRTGYGGEETVDYDRDTRVVYRQQRYSVRSLEPGDEVSMQVSRDSRGGLYTDLIRVERSARERRGARDRNDRYERDGRERRNARETTLQGRVGRIDLRQGWFQLQESRGSYRVTLPSRPGSSTVERFRRLRTGDVVRVEGRLTDGGRLQLSRFR